MKIEIDLKPSGEFTYKLSGSDAQQVPIRIIERLFRRLLVQIHRGRLLNAQKSRDEGRYHNMTKFINQDEDVQNAPDES